MPLNKNFFLPLGVFILAFFYIFNFTVDVNPHWESNLFIESMASAPFSLSLLNIFRIGGEYITASQGPFNSVYYKILFFLFGYDYLFYRIIKSLFFSGAILFFYLLCTQFLKKKYALGASLFVLFSFPLFIQTLVFDEGFIIGEFFKMGALYFFFNDVNRDKSHIISRLLVLFFSILAIRTYTPEYALSAILLLYVLFVCRQKLKQYWWVLLYIILTKVPLDGRLGFGASSYGFKLSIFSKFLFGDAVRYISSPLPYFSDLYYRPFVSVMTFFGFWLFLVFVLLFLSRDWLNAQQRFNAVFNKTEFSSSKKSALIFLLIWVMCELPIFFILPEPAIRYAAAIILPSLGIFFLFFQETEEILNWHKRKIIVIFFILFSFAILTNFSYAVLFRATWGSSFIGMDKTSYYILENNLEKNKKAIVYYYATSVAPEYYAVDKESSDKYTVSNRIIPLKIDISKISSAYFEEQKDEETEIYVIKRISSFGNSQYPSLNFDTLPYLKKITVIEGRSDNAFDNVFNFLTSVLKIPYDPNTFYIYKYESTKY